MANRTRAEKKGNKPKLSAEAQTQVQAITANVVPVSFTKQQRKEVQQAIEKGMEKVRTQTKIKNRERDKNYKKLQKQLDAQSDNVVNKAEPEGGNPALKVIIPWSLLALSWLGFASYLISA